MTPDTSRVEIRRHAVAAYELLRADRQRTLVALEDDMWTSFADLAAPHALMLGAEVVGRFSVDQERQQHGFYVHDESTTRKPGGSSRSVSAGPTPALPGRRTSAWSWTPPDAAADSGHASCAR